MTDRRPPRRSDRAAHRDWQREFSELVEQSDNAQRCTCSWNIEQIRQWGGTYMEYRYRTDTDPQCPLHGHEHASWWKH